MLYRRRCHAIVFFLLFGFLLAVTTSASVASASSWSASARIRRNLHQQKEEDLEPDPPLLAQHATTTTTTTRQYDNRNNNKKNFLSATVGSNMVLQRDKPAVLWGFISTTPSNTTITTVLQKGQSDPFPPLTTTVIDTETGLWRQVLPIQNASTIPYTIHITSTSNGHDEDEDNENNEEMFLDNVLFGDVYICGGQSNMQFTLDGTTNGIDEAIVGNNYPHVRLFTVGQGTGNSGNGKPLLDLHTIEQHWIVANEESLLSYNGDSNRNNAFGYFSSVCWFFGREIADGLQHVVTGADDDNNDNNNQQQDKVPIGLISNNWGGTAIELWKVGGDLYNTMIYPYMVGPMSITGFAWYQGEANMKNITTADLYAKNFPQMIQQWRNGFQQDHDALYFGFIQLSTWCPKTEPEGVPLLRQAQMSALDLPKIGYATNADHGSGCNVHPPTKQYCGMRLGKSALALQYGQKKVHWKSPSLARATTTTSTTNAVHDHRQDDVGVGGQGKHIAVIDLADVTTDGLYILDSPYNLLDGNFHCEQQVPGTCAWASLKLTKAGWVNATISILFPAQVILSATSDDQGGPLAADDVIEETSYGWGPVPMMTLYDKGSGLPVLPWKEKVRAVTPTVNMIKRHKNGNAMLTALRRREQEDY